MQLNFNLLVVDGSREPPSAAVNFHTSVSHHHIQREKDNLIMLLIFAELAQ